MMKLSGRRIGGALLSILLLLSLMLGLSACGGAGQEESAAEEAEPIHLVWWVYGANGAPAAMDEVLEKANELLSLIHI